MSLINLEKTIYFLKEMDEDDFKGRVLYHLPDWFASHFKWENTETWEGREENLVVGSLPLFYKIDAKLLLVLFYQMGYNMSGIWWEQTDLSHDGCIKLFEDVYKFLK